MNLKICKKLVTTLIKIKEKDRKNKNTKENIVKIWKNKAKK